MASYVFSRLLAESRCGELLSLLDQFNTALKEWLALQVSTEIFSQQNKECSAALMQRLCPALKCVD